MSAWDHFDACVRAAMRFVRDIDAARDIATEVCGTSPEDITPSLLKGALIARAKWRAIDHLRRGALPIVQGYDIDRAPAATPTPEEELIAKQERASIALLLGADALLLLENPDGLSDAELAVRLETSEEAIRQRRSRARRRLIEVD